MLLLAHFLLKKEKINKEEKKLLFEGLFVFETVPHQGEVIQSTFQIKYTNWERVGFEIHWDHLLSPIINRYIADFKRTKLEKQPVLYSFAILYCICTVYQCIKSNILIFLDTFMEKAIFFFKKILYIRCVEKKSRQSSEGCSSQKKSKVRSF